MARFKVGDRVMVNYDRGRALVAMWHSRGYGVEPGCIVATDVSHEYPHRVKLDIPRDGDDGYWWCAENELTPIPSIPDGWTPASEPPDTDRNVRVTLRDGREWYGWCGDKSEWFVFNAAADIDQIKTNSCYSENCHNVLPGEVIDWREIEPLPEPEPEPKPAVKTRYATRDSNDEWDETDDNGDEFESYAAALDWAKRCASSPRGTVQVWKWTLVAEITPGEPIVKTYEDKE